MLTFKPPGRQRPHLGALQPYLDLPQLSRHSCQRLIGMGIMSGLPPHNRFAPDRPGLITLIEKREPSPACWCAFLKRYLEGLRMAPNDLLKRYLEGARKALNEGKPTQDKADKLRKERALNQRRRAASSSRDMEYSGSRETYSPPSDFPLQSCDFQNWTKFDSLPIERACFVLLGFKPPPLDCLIFEQNRFDPSPPPTWDRPPEYDNVLGPLRSSIAHGNIQVHKIDDGQHETQQVCWPELIRWARSKSYPIPPALEDIVAKMEPVAVAGGASHSAPELPPDIDNKPQGASAQKTGGMPVETQTQRQDRRLQACIDAGLPMNTKAALSRLPDGVGAVAGSEGVTRQTFSTDVKAALKRREVASCERGTVHRA